MKTNAYKTIIENFKDKCYINDDLSKHHTFKISGTADIVVKPTSLSEVSELIKMCKENLYKYQIIGNGSNILFENNQYKGVLISTKSMNNISVEDNKIICQCGASLPLIAYKAMQNNLGGLEKISGVPGTIGGAVVMNAGAYGDEIKDILDTVTVLDKDMNILTLTTEELDMSYRHSNVKKNKYIVLECQLKLPSRPSNEIKSEMDIYKGKRIASQPLEYPNAGSIFKREENVFAGKLIDELGLKGFSIGGATVSEKHANFIVNSNKATTRDIQSLIEYIQKSVLEKFNLKLNTEVEII